MLSIPTHSSRSMGLHVLLAIAFGITELLPSGSGIPPYKMCENVSGKTICYFRGSEKLMTWNEARHLCNSFSGTLPVIRNINDQDFLAGYLRLNSYSTAWTAGKSFIHSNWTWINGRQLDETDQVVLQEDEARTEEEENYAVLNTAFNFTARAASVELTYICQYISYVGIHCSPPADIVVANNCLRLINTKRSWFDARNHCLNTNGELAVISDDVLERLKKNLTMNGRYWIGLRKKSWLWSRKYNAESYDEIKYTNWDSNEPPRDGECISIRTSNYKWKAAGCSGSKTVVCQTVSDISTDTRPTTTPGSQGPNTSRTALFVVVGLAIVIIIFVTLKAFDRSGNFRDIGPFRRDSPHSYNNNELGCTSAPVDTPVNDTSSVPLRRSDNIQGTYAEASASNQWKNGVTTQQPEISYMYAPSQFIVYPSLLEPDITRAHTAPPEEVGPLGLLAVQ